MKTYVDNKSRSWTIRVTVATLRRCKDIVDLANPETWLDEVYRSPTRLAEIVHAIANNGLPLEELEEDLYGERIANLRAMLLEEMIDFFQDRTGRGELLAALVANMNRTIETKLTAAVQEIMSDSTAS
jgi:hypothetical protein